MADRMDHGVREIDRLRPRLRHDLRTTFQQFRGEPCYVLEDPVAGAFFRLGVREYQFLSQLDGHRTVGEVVTSLAARAGRHSLREAEAATLIRRLLDAELLDLAASGGRRTEAGGDAGREASGRLAGKTGNPLFLRLPLGNPDAWLARLSERCAWFTGPTFFFLWLLVAGWAVVAISGQWTRFGEELRGVFRSTQWVWLWVLWVLLKIVHELGHGIACRRFGGRVPEFGVVLIALVTPLGYVDATAANGFPSRRRRLFVSIAGMYAEVFVASLAAIVWSYLEPGSTSATLQQVILVSGFVTLLFNANPLMRFDGYYVLADFVGIPNLYQKAGQAAAHFWKRWLIGLRELPSPLREGEPRGPLLLYGLACQLWRVMIMISVLLMAAALFGGAGIFLAVIAGLGLLANWLRGIGRYWREGLIRDGGRPWPAAVRVALLIGGGVALLWWLPAPTGKTVEGVVVLRDHADLRVRCPGFLADLQVREGETVKAGQVLLRLENREEGARLARLELEIARARLARDRYQETEEVALVQAESEKLKSLQEKLTRQRAFVESLVFRAPRDGVVVSPDLASLEGRYLPSGQLILSVVQPHQKEILFALPQGAFGLAANEAARGPSNTVKEARARILGRGAPFPIEIALAEPGASVQLPHPALASVTGGPLVVRERSFAASLDSPGSGSSGEGVEVGRRFELAKAHQRARAALPESVARKVQPGERVQARTRIDQDNRLLAWCWERMDTWWKGYSGDRQSSETPSSPLG